MEEMLKEILYTVKNIEKRIDKIEKRQDEFDQKLEKMSNDFDQKLDQRFAQMNEELDQKFDQRFAQINEEFDKKLDKSNNETAIEIRELAETISKIMNKKHDELLAKIDEVIKQNQIDHNIFAAKQKWLESEIEKINMQKVG